MKRWPTEHIQKLRTCVTMMELRIIFPLLPVSYKFRIILVFVIKSMTLQKRLPFVGIYKYSTNVQHSVKY